LSTIFPQGYRISFHCRVLPSSLGARRGAPGAPPSAQCLSSSLPRVASMSSVVFERGEATAKPELASPLWRYNLL